MTLTIQLSADAESRLKQEATRKGVDVAQLARDLIEQQLLSTSTKDETLSLLAAWNAEDATEEASVLEARRREWEEFKHALNESHSSHRRIYP